MTSSSNSTESGDFLVKYFQSFEKEQVYDEDLEVFTFPRVRIKTYLVGALFTDGMFELTMNQKIFASVWNMSYWRL